LCTLWFACQQGSLQILYALEDDWDQETAAILETYAPVDAVHTHILHEKLLEFR
jgi:hypothetical protein